MKIVRKARIYRTNCLKRKSKKFICVRNNLVCFNDRNILVFNNTSPDSIRNFAIRYLSVYIKMGVKFCVKVNGK